MTFLQIHRSGEGILIHTDVQFALTLLGKVSFATQASFARQGITACIEIEEQSLALHILADSYITLSCRIIEENLIVGDKGCRRTVQLEVLLLVVPSVALVTGPDYVLCRITGLVDGQHQLLAFQSNRPVLAIQSQHVNLCRIGIQFAGTFGKHQFAGGFRSHAIDGKGILSLQGQVAVHDKLILLLVLQIHIQFHIHLAWYHYILIDGDGAESVFTRSTHASARRQAAACIVVGTFKMDTTIEHGVSAQCTLGLEQHLAGYLAVYHEFALAYHGITLEFEVIIKDSLALHRLIERHVASQLACSSEDKVVILRCHHIHGRWLHLAIDIDGLGIITTQVEHHTLAILIACRRGLVETGEARCSLPQGAAILISQLGLHEWWQWGIKHVVTQIETGVWCLIITACGAVETIVRVFEQGVHRMVGRNIGTVSDDTRRRVGILLHQDNLLTPVALDVATEGRTGSCSATHGTRGTIVALILMAEEVVDMLASVNRSLGDVEITVIAAASILRNLLSAQVTIPPDTIGDVASGGILHQLALSCPRMLSGIAPEFQSQMVGVDIEGITSTHIIYGREIPLLDVLARG